jgi:hypothetical protein
MSPEPPSQTSLFFGHFSNAYMSNSLKMLEQVTMSQTVQQFGPVTLARARSAVELKRLPKRSLARSRQGDHQTRAGTALGTFTDSDTLRMLLGVLDSKIIITEAYQINRTTVTQSDNIRFSVEGKERSWHWLLKGGWGWVQRNPCWLVPREGSLGSHPEDGQMVPRRVWTSMASQTSSTSSASSISM